MEQGAKDRKGHKDEAQSLFGAVSGLSVSMTIAAKHYLRTNHDHLITVTSSPVRSLIKSTRQYQHSTSDLHVKSLDQMPFNVAAFATAHIAVLEIT